jgi:hypothetical protein
MFNNISWQGYWTCIALLTGGYYLVVLLLYYRSDFKVLLRSKSLNHFQTPELKIAHSKAVGKVLEKLQPPFLDNITVPEFQTPLENSDESLVYACMDELNAFFEEAKKSKTIKEELLYALQLILQKYPSIRSSQYKESLEKIIVTQCKHICSVHLKEGDVACMWF